MTFIIEGYACLFKRVDLGGDTIAPGAFTKSLNNRESGDVLMTLEHKLDRVIGSWLSVVEKPKGLYVIGEISPVSLIPENLNRLLDGELNGLSIGFKTLHAVKGHFNTRYVTEIDLWEVSVVTLPMQLDARFAVSNLPV